MAIRRIKIQRSGNIPHHAPSKFFGRVRRGFTLIELLVVVAIIAILVAMLLPALSTARKNAQAAICLSNLKNTGTALMMYATTWNEWLPVAYNPYDGKDIETNWNGALIHLNYLKDYESLFCPSAPPIWKNFSLAQRDYLGYFTYGMGGDYNGNVHMRLSDSWRPEASEILLDSLNLKPESSSWYVGIFGNTGPVQSMRVLKYRGPIYVERVDFRHLRKTNLLFMDFHAVPCKPDTMITAYYKYQEYGTVGIGAYYAFRVTD